MDDDGVVVATDSNLGRLSALRSNAERLGVTNVAVTHEDARNHSLKPFDNAEYDRALVDVPCSCEGTIRKNPDALDDWEYDHVKGISGVQKGVLRRAVQATKEVGPSSTRRVRSRPRRTRPSSTTSSRRRPAASSTSRYPRFGPRRHPSGPAAKTGPVVATRAVTVPPTTTVRANSIRASRRQSASIPTSTTRAGSSVRNWRWRDEPREHAFR